jgi:predicted Zn finger-like uncharacterized protein
MILTCPECATRYFIDDHKLGPNGRTVRCASCGAAWKASTEEPLELTAADRGGLGQPPGEPLSFKPVEDQPELSAPELPRAFRARAEQRRKVRQAAVAGVVWAGLASGFAALLLGAYVFRVDVVKLYPRAAGAYAMAGVPVNPTGLEFEQIKASPAPDGLAAVTVSGAIRNVEDEPSAPPPIRVALVDKGGKKLAATLVTVGGPVAPGQVRAFSVSLPDPDAATANVDVAFALELAPKPAPKAALAPAPAHKPAAPQLKTASPPQVAGRTPAAPQADAARAGLRPAIGLEPAATEAKPLAAGDPYALDGAPARAAPGRPHG